MILAIAGALVMVVSVVGGIALGVIGIGGSVSDVMDGDVIDGRGTVTLQAGDDRQLYKRDDSPTPSCTVQAPGGGEPAGGPSQSSSVSMGSVEWESFASFRADEAGAYTVECSDGDVLVAPPLSIGGIFAGVGGILLAVFGGIFGIILLIIGIVLRVTASTNKNHTGGGWPGQYGQPDPYGHPGPYGKPGSPGQPGQWGPPGLH